MKKLWFLALLFAAGCSSPSGTNNSNSTVFGIWKTSAYWNLSTGDTTTANSISLDLISDDSAIVTMTLTGTTPPQTQTNTYPVHFAQPFIDSIYTEEQLSAQNVGTAHELRISWVAPTGLDPADYTTTYNLGVYHVSDSLVGGMYENGLRELLCTFTR